MMYALMIGPMAIPKLDIMAHRNIHHILSLALDKSSILPGVMVVGIPDRTPVMKRPMTMPATDGTTAVKTQKILYSPVLHMYSFFRPKDSEYGGKITPPTPCPKR